MKWTTGWVAWVLMIAGASAQSIEHGTLAGGGARVSIAASALDTGPKDLSSPVWVFPASDASVTGPVRLVGASGPVVAGRLVVAVSGQDVSTGTPARLWGIERATGLAAWSAEVPGLIFDSVSTPTIDRKRGTVLYASGRGGPGGGVLRAHRLTDGGLVWEAGLPLDVVNATAVVTGDRPGRDRAFITDFEGFFTGGSGGSLVCVNVDAFDAAVNPFVPGEVLWAAPLMSGTSGATPAYDGRLVYVATAGDFDFAVGGEVVAFDAGALTAAGAEVWRAGLGGDDGFFGGVSVARGGVFAATFDFFGGLNSARVVKLRASDGAVQWVAASNRTNSIPIPLADGRVVLSGGFPGFGSVPTVQVYEDLGTGAALIGDSAAETFIDRDGDGLIGAGEFEALGGWLGQPVVVERHPATGGPAAFVGTIDTDPGVLVGGFERLSLVDLDVPFGAAGSVVSSFEGAGSAPAVSGGSLYTIGAGGVYAFGAYCAGDVDLSGAADMFDVLAHLGLVEGGAATADTTLDGTVDASDVRAVVRAVGAVGAGCGP